MYEKFGQFIDGKWQQAEKKETYDVINPATEEVIGKASKASSIEVQKALKSAEKGLEVWKNTAPVSRKGFGSLEKYCTVAKSLCVEKNCRSDERKKRCTC